MKLTVYLAGEIHTDWRDELIGAVQAKGLDIEFVSPQLNHDLSDGIGEQIKGEQPDNYFRDLAASDVNNFRTQVMEQGRHRDRPVRRGLSPVEHRDGSVHWNRVG